MRDWPWVFESCVNYSTAKLQSLHGQYPNRHHEHFARFREVQYRCCSMAMDLLSSLSKARRMSGESIGAGVLPTSRHSSTYQSRSYFLLHSRRTKLSRTDLFGITSAVIVGGKDHVPVLHNVATVKHDHVSKECSSAPRCYTCAGMLLSSACTIDPTVDRESLRCALCGGAHDATDKSCELRKAERQRLRLENPFYRTVL